MAHRALLSFDGIGGIFCRSQGPIQPQTGFLRCFPRRMFVASFGFVCQPGRFAHEAAGRWPHDDNAVFLRSWWDVGLTAANHDDGVSPRSQR